MVPDRLGSPDSGSRISFPIGGGGVPSLLPDSRIDVASFPMVFWPGIEELGRFPGTDMFCDKAQYPGVLDIPGVHIIRLNSGSFCFGNASPIKERITRLVTSVDEKEEANTSIYGIIVDMSSVMSIDSSGILALEEIYKQLVSRNTHLAIINPRWKVIHKLKLAGFIEKVGSGCIFLTVNEAIDACLSSKSIGHGNC